jgi:hypothetical protein
MIFFSCRNLCCFVILHENQIVAKPTRMYFFVSFLQVTIDKSCDGVGQYPDHSVAWSGSWPITIAAVLKYD